MKLLSTQLRLSATDVSNHLACRHLTSLDISEARGERQAPQYRAPDLKVIQELGHQHEARYLKHLAAQNLQILNLDKSGSESSIAQATLDAMKQGVDVIAQGALQIGHWFGRPDVLCKVDTPSPVFGNHSYEAHDCKLARETKATTILQLSFYSELLTELQGVPPEYMRVIPPGTTFKGEAYRVAEYAAYYRYVKDRLEKATSNGSAPPTYPEPCAHCEICRWFADCDKLRRAHDHLSLVAGIRTQQRTQLESWNRKTVAQLAELPIPLKEKPLHGSREGMERVREQARVQIAGRSQDKLVHELLKVEPDTGFCKLPEPTPADMFVDLEGDPFAGNLETGGGQEYLFGFVAQDAAGARAYHKQWALDPEEEKRGFEWLVDEVMQRWKQNPAMHIYHFAAYEPTAFKRLMGRYATREEEVDSMLRAGLFVDLHTVLKQAMLASVEQYSLKKLESLPAFVRKVPLADSREAMYFVEHKLQLGRDLDLPEKHRAAMEGYNADDCFATAVLRDWLEAQRSVAITNGGNIPRPPLGDGAPSEDLDEKQKRVAALVEKLKAGIPLEPEDRTKDQAATLMLANLLDWHRREDKWSWAEGYRLADLDDDALLEDRAGLSRLAFVERICVDNKIPTDLYTFAKQETDVRADKDVYVRIPWAELTDPRKRKLKVGRVVSMDPVSRTISIKKTKKTADLHPPALFTWDSPLDSDVHAESLFRIGEWVAENGISAPGRFQAIRDLLLREIPRLSRNEELTLLPLEEHVVTACRVASALNHSVFAIQGPPGSGKTFTAAHMICKLASDGKRIGVTALSHNVIRKLLEKVARVASVERISGVKCAQRLPKDHSLAATDDIAVFRHNETALKALASGEATVLGGSTWMWTPDDSYACLDAVFIDEAGQMALADVVALGQAAKNIFLIGDPQQLERPVKGSHPDGSDRSALEHLIGKNKTIPTGLGMLLPHTRRMHPTICRFTSEMFYENKLSAFRTTHPYRLEGHQWLSGAGLWFVPGSHEGNRNSSAEEVEIIHKIIASLLAGGVTWFRSATESRAVTLEDILVVAPYNAQVSDLLARLPKGARVGTVDKFQGQEAAVVIYSLTTSSPEDAPRGMEFLYSLNRFNVATSRAMSNVIVVGSPRLFEPECRSPRQIQLANALCRYREMATVVDPSTL